MKPQRNAACPCGSGRKYKKCCLEATKDLESQRMQLRRVEGLLMERLLPYVLGRYGPELAEHAWQAFFFSENVPEDKRDDPHLDTIFFSWMLLDWVPGEGGCGQAGWPTVPLMLDYLQSVGDFDSFEERVCRKMSDRPYSFYSVIEVEPGVRMKIQDVLTLEEHVVLEQSASRIVQRGCILFSKVLTEGKASILVGAAPILIPPIERASLISLREGLSRLAGGKVTEEMLGFMNDVLRRKYLELAYHQLDPPELEFRNTDGDALVFHTVRFRLHCSPYEAFHALKSLAWGYEEEDLLADAKFDRSRQLRAVEFPWCVEGNPVHRDWSNTILGHFSIKGETLTVEVNSKPRAERVCTEIHARLGDRAELRRKVVKPVEKLLEASRSRPESAAERRRRERDNEFARRPDVQQEIRRMAKRHWEAWLDTEIPALGGRTPQEAVRTRQGRELLEALLDDFAFRNGWRTEDAFAPPTQELRCKLGLTTALPGDPAEAAPRSSSPPRDDLIKSPGI